jgi:DNA polymerase III subunit alpha
MPNIEEWDEKQLLTNEKEVLGYYLTAHPLSGFQETLSSFCSHVTTELKNCKDREEVMVGGMIGSIKIAHVKNPKPGQSSKYANFDLEDVEGMVRCIAWPDMYSKVGEFIIPDAVVLLRATVDRRAGGDEINLLANEVIPIAEADARFTSGMQVFMNVQEHREETFQRLREILRGYPGARDVMIALKMEDGEVVHIRSGKHRVDIQPELRARLDDLLGSGGHKLIVNKPKLKAAPEKNFRQAKN